MSLTVDDVLPTDPGARLVGRVLDPAVGPCVVTVDDGRCVDITPSAPTTSDLLERPDLLEFLPAAVAAARRSWPLGDLVEASIARDPSRPQLLAPIDLQVIKAAGVTFARSMLERVIEERAKGDPSTADDIRHRISEAVGGTIGSVRPGSDAAAAAKQVLIDAGLWSQYLEVGIGPDPEIFTKAPVLSAVGFGAQVGVLERSTWNNPEPEVVLAITAGGTVVGASLGNDVNLRDFEGRSALLLGEAKDNNASCAIGPFLRLFDETFSLDDVRALDVELTITGRDGFTLHDVSSMRQMSRDLEDLVDHAIGPHHSYPDGLVLFTGTMFAPTQDRDAPGSGFTHHDGDVVTIATPALGRLDNEVTSAEAAPAWQWGIRRLVSSLADRGIRLGGDRA